MAAQPPPFALAPALVGANLPIDYSTRAGQSIYATAISPLPIKYDGAPGSLPAFLQVIRNRSAACGWIDIFTINIGQDDQGNDVDRDLLTHYGEITLDDVRANAIADYMGMMERNAQVSHQIFQCLQASITENVAKRLVTEADRYHIDGMPDGPSYLMTIVQTYFVQTLATPTQLRLKISDAHILIGEHEFNIDKFNTELNSYVQELAATGQTTEDMFAHITKAYRLVPNREFKTYIQNRIDEHNDGTRPLTTVQLMDKAKSKFDEMNESKTWTSEDDTEKQLVALTAQLEQIQLTNKRLNKKFKANTPSKDFKRKNKNKKFEKDDAKWKWKDSPPKKGETTKVFQGKTYYFCVYHRKWTLHKPDECRLKDKPESPEHQTNNDNNPYEDKMDKLQSMAAIIEDDTDMFGGM